MAQLVKNPPAVQETWVQSLGWEDPLEKGKATHSIIVAWRIPWTVQSMGLKSQTPLSDFHSTSSAGGAGSIPAQGARLPYTSGSKSQKHKTKDYGNNKGFKKKKKLFGEGNGNPPQYSCLGDLTDRGAWQAIMHGIAKGSNTV